jgi:hypothetical protein
VPENFEINYILGFIVPDFTPEGYRVAYEGKNIEFL